MPVGTLGTGTVTKIVHNALAMSVDLLMTLGVKSGVELPGLIEAFKQGCIAGGNTMFTERVPATLFRGDCSARFALNLAAKDFALAESLAERNAVPTRLVDLCHAELREAMARGWGEDDRTRASTPQEERADVALRLPVGVGENPFAASAGRSVEQAGDRAFLGNAADRLADQRGDLDGAHLLARLHRLGRLDRIGHGEGDECRILHPADRLA